MMNTSSHSMIKLQKALELYFVRNGETVGNTQFKLQGQTQGELSEKGIQQAELVGKELQKLQPIQKVYVSPLLRAQDTLKYSGIQNIPVIQTELLAERQFGELTNFTYLDMINLPPSQKPTNGESLEDLRLRAQKFLESILEQNPKEGRILVFAHHEIILSCIMTATGIPLEHTRQFMISNASISQLDFYNGRWVAKRINELGHLGDLKQTERSY